MYKGTRWLPLCTKSCQLLTKICWKFERTLSPSAFCMLFTAVIFHHFHIVCGLDFVLKRTSSEVRQFQFAYHRCDRRSNPAKSSNLCRCCAQDNDGVDRWSWWKTAGAGWNRSVQCWTRRPRPVLCQSPASIAQPQRPSRPLSLHSTHELTAHVC